MIVVMVSSFEKYSNTMIFTLDRVFIEELSDITLLH